MITFLRIVRLVGTFNFPSTCSSFPFRACMEDHCELKPINDAYSSGQYFKSVSAGHSLLRLVCA